MDWFLYDNGLRHKRVKSYFSLHTIFPNVATEALYNAYFLFNSLSSSVALI